MPLLGPAAMLLGFDVAPDAVDAHDHWHSLEHLPERLSIPGFLRGTRWIAVRGGPRYLVVYEVESLATLSSAPYLARLNQPTPWTSRVMPHYRGMRRGFCDVTGSFGLGQGRLCALVRFGPVADAASSLRRWLVDEVLPRMPGRPGIGSAHLLEAAATPVMTAEQRIRGADVGVGWAVLVHGYREDALAQRVGADLDPSRLAERGAGAVESGLYRLDDALSCSEAPGASPTARSDLDRPRPIPSLRFRQAVPEDSAECVALRGRTRENAVSAERLAAVGITVESWGDDIATGKLPGHVCIADDRIVGYGFGDRDTGEVMVLALLPEFERRGIGRALLAKVVADLRASGHERLFLGCARDPAKRSHGFYRHLGWRSTGEIDANDDEVLELLAARPAG